MTPTSFDEEAAYVGALSAVDDDSDPTALSYALLQDDSGQFEVVNDEPTDGDAIRLMRPLDFENLPAGFTLDAGGTTASTQVTIEVTDESLNSYDKEVTLTVDDVDEFGDVFIFRLVNAESDTVIDADLSDGVQGLDQDDLASQLAVAAYAAVPGSITGSVALKLAGPSGAFNKTESSSPYAIFGDTNVDDFYGKVLEPGEYTLSASYAGTTETIVFTLDPAVDAIA